MAGIGHMKFADASAISRLDDSTFGCHLQENWSVVGKTNGGYMLAIAARAVAEATNRPDPVTITAHFVTPGEGGDAAVSVDTVRSGRRASTAMFRLDIEDRPVIAGIATTADLRAASGVEDLKGAAPRLPSPEDCIRVLPGSPFPPPLMDYVDVRLHPDDAAFVFKGPSGEAQMRGWVTLPDGQPIDSMGLVFLSDVFPPTSFNAGFPVTWTPTVELTTHIRNLAAPGWLACSFTSRFATNGYLETDGEIWDSDGKLVVHSRQLQSVRMPQQTAPEEEP